MMRLLQVLALLACFTSSTQAQNYVGGFDIAPSVTPTIQAAQYVSGNAIGGLQSVNVFRNDAQPSGVLTNFWVASKGGATAAITVFIFDTNPAASTCTDKVAFVLNAADVSKLAAIPFVLTPAALVGSTVTFAQAAMATSVKNGDATPTVKLYVCMVFGATVTPASTSDIVFKISGGQD